MTTLKRTVVTRRTIEHELPAPEPYGANWVQVQKMLRAVRADYLENSEGLTPDQDPADDAVTVRVRGDGDDAVMVFSYELDTTREHGDPRETGARKPGRADMLPIGRASQLREIAETTVRVLDKAASLATDRDPTARMTPEWLDRLGEKGDAAYLLVPAPLLAQLAAQLDVAGFAGWWAK